MRKIAPIFITILILLVFAACSHEPAPVVKPVEEISLDSVVRTAETGNEFTLHATVVADEGVDKTVTWSSSSILTASVDKDGNVKANAPGNAFITATAGNKSVRCLVMVLPEIIPVELVSIDRYFSFISEGETIKLNAIVKPDNATFKDVTWASSDETVATVNADGEVTAIAKKGLVTISATVGGKTGKCDIMVLPEPILVRSITLDKHFTSVAVGANATLKATVNPENATYYKVIWESSDEKIVTVNNGVLTGVGEGFATVTATAGNRVAICMVAVDKNTVTVKYDANDGSGKTWEQDIPKDKEANLSEVMFSRKDYVFTGWNTKKDYTGDMFFDGETVEFSDDVTLYAQWIHSDLFGIENDGRLVPGSHYNDYIDSLSGNLCLPKTIGGKQVTSIGKQLFIIGHGVPNIKQIKIPDGVTKVDYQAFNSCSELEWIYIPASMTDHDASAFSQNAHMRFKVHPDNARYTTNDDGSMLLSKDKKILYSWPSCPENPEVPEGIEEIGARAFLCSGIKDKLTLPKSIKRIGDSSFYWTDNLRELHVKGNLESIDYMAFESYADRDVGLTKAVFDGDVGTICDSALSAGYLETVEFKGNIKQINEHAFLLVWYLKEQGLSIKIRGKGEPAKLDEKAFEGANISEIRVPAELVNTYKEKWSVVAEQIKPLED